MKKTMNSTLSLLGLTLLALITTLYIGAHSARAEGIENHRPIPSNKIIVKNDSERPSWITLYNGMNHKLQYDCVMPGQSREFQDINSGGMKVEVRAEVYDSTDCRGHRLSDISLNVRADLRYEGSQVSVKNNGGYFYLEEQNTR